MRQTSFIGGELSPLLWGRQELELYGVSLRRLRNFVVAPQGALISRPGTQLAWTAKQPTVVLAGFLHSSGEAYVLELGHVYVRIYNARTLALVQEVVTVFQEQHLRELQWTQVGNLVLFTHSAYEPQELDLRTPVAAIRAVRTSPPGETDGAPALTPLNPSIGGSPPKEPVLVQWQDDTLFVVDEAHPPREWRYLQSTLVRHVLTGEEAETLPTPITQYTDGNVEDGTVLSGTVAPLPADGHLILFPDAPIYIQPGLGGLTPVSSNWVPVENLWYRGRGRLFGLVGRSAPDMRFADFGEEPNYLLQPLRAEVPWTAAAGSYPSCAIHHGQRRVFGGPFDGFVTSAVDEWRNFDEPFLPWPGQPLRAALVGKRRVAVRGMAELEHLFIFADSGVWRVGRPDLPLDYDTLPSVVRQVDEVGSQAIAPLVVGEAILWAREKGRGVRALVQQQGAFSAVDASWHAEHLFRGPNARVRQWAFARDPWATAWVVRDDGALLSCGVTASGSWAWGVHELGDVVQSVCVVPQADATAYRADSDVVFFAVTRGGQTRIEKMTPSNALGLPRYATDPLYEGNPIGAEQLWYPLDSYTVATVTKATGTTINGLGHLEGRAVWLSCPGIDPVGPLTVTGGEVTTPAGWGPTGATTFKAAVGLLFWPELELLDAPVARLNQKTVKKVGIEVDQAVGLQVGETWNKLVDWQQRSISDGYEYPSAASALVVVNVGGTWRRSGRAVLRQSKPLPVTVLGITRELDVGGS